MQLLNTATYINKPHMYDNVRVNAVPTSYRTYTVDLLIKSTLDITILELRFVLVLHKMQMNPYVYSGSPLQKYTRYYDYRA